MPNKEDILWFKQQFQKQIEATIQGTPFSIDLITAIACQETGEVWPVLRKKAMEVDRLLELCVGDTLDADKGRKAFPQTKAALLAVQNGGEMFAIARQALEDMAEHIAGYKKVAKNPNKFCHGFGIFQLDLQFFLKDPDYFLEKKYADFDASLAKCIGELQTALKKLGWGNRTSLSDFEMVAVAIVYNTGGFKPQKGLKQGFFDGSKFYGEAVFDFLRLAQTVSGTEGVPPALAPAAPGNASVPPPTPVSVTGDVYEVNVQENMLRLRREPIIDEQNPNGNVIARLPDGHLVQAVTGEASNGFLEVETSLRGAHLRGFAAVRLLKLTAERIISVDTPGLAPLHRAIAPVMMPRKEGIITTRNKPAGPLSLNEPGQPGRKGATPDELRQELAAIIDWLAVDDLTHRRYQPGNNHTFCNIYAHDYCHLAGVYLPRVWWTQAALVALAQGKSVVPLLGKTIEEQRANDLYRWLRDFGLQFGWRQTGTLSKLQLEVNQGAIGILVARRRNDGRSGHIVAVVPETQSHQARRNATGEVVAPLQSQAGAKNFRYGTGRPNWWLDVEFAEHAWWLHS
ncbi:MAG: hypothetical protein K1Y36_01570 [Blastocatellia bacterium]|nr:hypothetical protein [Blastocatellia bacterium]